MRDKQNANVRDAMLTKRRRRGWRCPISVCGTESCVKDSVCVCVCVGSCTILWVILVVLYLCHPLVSSQDCLGLQEKGLLTSCFFCPHILIFPLSPPSFPGFPFPPTVLYLFFTSTLLVAFLSPSLFLFWPLLLSCSVVVEVCGSLLFLSVWADVWHLPNPRDVNR